MSDLDISTVSSANVRICTLTVLLGMSDVYRKEYCSLAYVGVNLSDGGFGCDDLGLEYEVVYAVLDQFDEVGVDFQMNVLSMT